MLCFALPPLLSQGQEPNKTYSEYEIKAAFIYKFASFIEWPDASFESEKSPFVIAIFGADPFGSILDATVQDKHIQGRPIVVKRIQQASETKNCNILFIAASEQMNFESIRSEIEGGAILTIGEWDAFTDQGGILRFLLQKNKIGFEINIKEARNAQLKISSQLLKLAKVVGDEKQEGE